MEDLRTLEYELQDFGRRLTSPKGRNGRKNAIWGKSETNTSEESMPAGTREQCRADTEYGELVNAIEKYVRIRMEKKKESLEHIAAKLQGYEADTPNKPGLCALFIALDESQSLTTHSVRKEHASEGAAQKRYVSVFRCIRRVTHEMYTESKVKIFMLLSDTTAKLADFVPERSQDPSARMMMGKTVPDVPGQPHAPFINLRTEAAGIMVVPKEKFDFPDRLKKFCKVWQSPNISQETESVTEEVTSISFDSVREQSEDYDVSMEKGFEPAIGKSVEKGEQFVTALEKNVTETVFRSDEEYLYLGRPL